MIEKQKVLFLCTGNSARSQMAEGLLRNLTGDRFEVFSAGVEPAQVNPLAIKVMLEMGIDISNQRSKSVMEFLNERFDYVITVCDNANETCPVFPGKYKKIHWGLKDPAGAKGAEEEKLMIFRETRDNLKGKITDFLTNKMVLIYDGECSLCQATKDWIERRVFPGQIEFLQCQSEERKRRFPQAGEEGCLQAMQVILPDGRILAGDEAIPEILSQLRRWRYLVYLFRLPCIKFLSPRIYAWVSKNRHKFIKK